MMTLDTKTLAHLDMTDYSFFGEMLEPSDTSSCICDTTTKPRFPLEVRIDRPQRRDGKDRMRMVFGIIDWLEQRVHYSSLSTMKEPELYREWYMRMFPVYFKLPPRAITGDFELRMARADSQPEEIMKFGDTVMAIEKVKWSSKKMIYGVKELHCEQMIEHGSSHKVIAGDYATVVKGGDFGGHPLQGAQGRTLLVYIKGKEGKLFCIRPEQVVRVPRKLGPKERSIRIAKP